MPENTPAESKIENTQVDVVTRHAIRNYGSVLQALATREILRSAGATSRFIDYRQPGYDDTGWSVANRGSARNFHVLGRIAYAALRDPGMRRIGRQFDRFLATELALTNDSYYSIQDLRSSKEFSQDSLYCVGSDQVWNINYNQDNSPYYLDFAPSGAPKFSLSSSIGMKKLPVGEERLLTHALANFTGVSVRERDAQDYLTSLGIEAEMHVDPTLALAPSFWRSFAGTQADSEPYVLVYQLNQASEVKAVAEAVAADLGVKVKRIEYWRGPRSLRHPSVVLPSLEEFVRLFRDAACVVTDSFHGTSFSTTFSTPYVAVPPPNYSGRISALLELTGQSHRLVGSVESAVDVIRDTTPLPDPEIELRSERQNVDGYVQRMIAAKGVR